MEIQRKFFPEVMRENDLAYFAHLEGLIDSIDEYSSMQITKSSDSYIFRLAPSMPKYGEMLLQEILKLHNVFGIKLDLSKSIKTSGTIVFRINLLDG
tara:strand:+ start:428 stop:718 length:291 start_codon:yes stop_codon:yes gene_type:complete